MREFLKVYAGNKEILDRYLSEYPVKLGALAKDLGVASVKLSNMKLGLSGQISREGDDYVIRINRNESRERQRFTIAHELAHFLLHRDIIDRSPDGITDSVLYRSGASIQVEYEANRLAAHLVMPPELVENRLQTVFGGVVTDETIEILAEEFDVSRAAMEIRLSAYS